ncbi:hypothetical protein ACHWQZ_G012685 [Mnemiopsis leidyi]
MRSHHILEFYRQLKTKFEKENYLDYVAKIAEIKDFGYKLLHHSKAGKGGGVAIAFKHHLDISRQNTPSFKSFEHIECVLNSSSSGLLRLICIYRSSTARVSNKADFFQEFGEYLESLNNLPGKLIIAGDFNIHVENATDPDTLKLFSLFQSYNLVQHVSQSTHIAGGTLDLVLSRNNLLDGLDISNVQSTKTFTTSDHYFVSFSCSFPHQRGLCKVRKTGRNIKKIDIEAFKTDLLHSDINNPEKFVDCDSATQLYNEELRRILDIHAPLQNFEVSPNQSKWMNGACQKARASRRKAERDHKRLNTESSKIAYKKAYKHADAVINTTRTAYYRDKLEANSHDKKETFNIINKLMDRDVSKDLRPNSKPDDTLCEEMKEYFKEKVDMIYSDIEIEANNVNIPNLDDVANAPPFTGDKWCKFKKVDEETLKDVLSELNKKECRSDPIPVKLLIQCIEEVKTIILFIVNESLGQGVFPSDAKSALVRPAIKDAKGDVNDFKNYRPISNLPFLSKILEKCVHKQLNIHLEDNNLHADRQSGYRANRSCETATLAVYNDLLCISDSRSKVIMLMLDLSAAFDTVCHSSLLKKLSKNFGLAGNVLKWFQSYLEGRSFSVTINKSKSGQCVLRIGVPQGSILGPILFILYTKDLNFIANKHGFTVHLYADDTQMYLEFNPLFSDVSKLEERIESCFGEIKRWMLAYKLKLNQNKTEVLMVQSKNNHYTWSLDALHLCSSEAPIATSPMVKSLGVRFDTYLSFDAHIDATVQACNIHLRNLWAIASKLSFNLKRQLVHCLIFSKLDYCNSLLYGLPETSLKKLQRVQNSSVRFLFGSKAVAKWESVRPLLKEAHFLPIRQRIDYKIGLIVFKCLNNMAPKYLSDCLSVKGQPAKALRGDQDYFLLDIPPVPNLARTERAFSFCAPRVWNSLPYDLRTCPSISVFKKGLKTHLFKIAFDS